MKNISPLYKFSLQGGGWDEQRQPKMQPSAEIVRVECTKCRRECDLSHARATLCGDRACRVREMQARVRFVPRARVSGELEDENWRLASTTLVRGASCGAGS